MSHIAFKLLYGEQVVIVNSDHVTMVERYCEGDKEMGTKLWIIGQEHPRIVDRNMSLVMHNLGVRDW